MSVVDATYEQDEEEKDEEKEEEEEEEEEEAVVFFADMAIVATQTSDLRSTFFFLRRTSGLSGGIRVCFTFLPIVHNFFLPVSLMFVCLLVCCQLPLSLENAGAI